MYVKRWESVIGPIYSVTARLLLRVNLKKFFLTKKCKKSILAEIFDYK